MNCERCGCGTIVTSMSYFNTETICHDCRERERAHPKFKEARAAEVEACRAGNFNYPGIGLPDDLKGSKAKG